MKAGEASVLNANGILPETIEVNSLQESSINASDSKRKPNHHTHTPSYQKLLESLKDDHKFQCEFALGKRVGFYLLRGELGSGNFSRVKAGVHALTKERVAIKILDKNKMDKKTKRLLSREISSMERLHHPHIIHLYEAIHTETKLHLVMEYASGGDLFTKLSTQGMMTESDAKIIFAQILSAVQHMHQHGVIHRDLKAENVFYSEKKLVKVGDFGFSTEAKSSKQALTTFCGSPPYAAPELFRDSFYYGERVDIWALGIMLYFTVTGTMPFRAETVGKLKKKILSGLFVLPSHLSSECKNLIRGILMPVPADRLSIAGIKTSNWLSNLVYPQSMGYYRLEPTKIDLNNCRPEEAYALYYLEKLGLGKDELQQFKFSSEYPFSWDSKTESVNKQAASRRYTNGSRAPQMNIYEPVEINENGALVGTYRILLLRAHRRFCGPTAVEELRKLRAVTQRSLAKSHDDDQSSYKETLWSCSLCEVKPSNGHVKHAGSESSLLSSDRETTKDIITPQPSQKPASAERSPDKKAKVEPPRTQHRSNPSPRSSAVKSKFCVLL